MSARTGILLTCTVMLCAPPVAFAQELRGVVRDSSSRLPIPGAVLVLFDASGSTIARGITNARGEYVLPLPQALEDRRVRVTRLGFRPRALEVGPAATQLDVAMISIPTLLESVRVVANASCPRRPDSEAAFALLEQARAGLLNAIVARETYRAKMTILAFERGMHETGDSVVRLNVRTSGGNRVTTSFYAVHKARDFVRDGFVRDSAGSRVFFGPDIDVLLDEDLNTGYCFHLREPAAARRNQVGLAFSPASRQRGRIDIDGTLWIDTAARRLEDLEYRYVGLPSAMDAVKPGGRTTFWELPNGVVFIDKWNMRLPQIELDTSYTYTNQRIVRSSYAAKEPGGEVASATWPDGQSYHGHLGVLNARAEDAAGRAVTGFVVRLSETDYVANPDSTGLLEITNLLPGPYTAVVIHPALAEYGIIVPAMQFVATRNAVVERTFVVPSPLALVRQPCFTSPSRYEDDPLLILKVTSADGQPLGDNQWQLKKLSGAVGAGVVESRLTDADGRARHCMLLESGDVVEIRAWVEGRPGRPYRKTIGRGGNKLTIAMPVEVPQ